MVQIRRVVPVLALMITGSLTAQPAAIRDALGSVDEDVRVYNEHLTILASPYMGGREPGTVGMERAKDYVQHHFETLGLEPAFSVEDDAMGGASVVRDRATFRQPFGMTGGIDVLAHGLSAAGVELEYENEFSVTALGGSGSANAEAVFVGYAIEGGPDGYSNFEDDTDLTGKVAVMFRFEPMDENGESLWASTGWSGNAGFAGKIRAVSRRDPAAIVIINPPECSDVRSETLMGTRGAGSGRGDTPVLMVSPAGGQRLVEALDANGPSLMEYRQMADEGTKPVAMGGSLNVEADLDRTEFFAENLGGILPGKGSLADEFIVVGAHLDHVGQGYFGSSSPGQWHPGADDNASGSSGLLLLAAKMRESYDSLGDDANARSVLFLAFSGEESGLLGARHYVEEPIVPLDAHELMINFDMIGRISDGRFSVSGIGSGRGLRELTTPFFEVSPLTVLTPSSISGRSDHWPFYENEIPIMFGIIADLHEDYHTPQDLGHKINREAAVEAVRLFHGITIAAAMHPVGFEYTGTPGRQQQSGPSMGDLKVRFGITPASYDAVEAGVPIAAVSDGGSAATGGVLAGDRLIRWDGDDIAGVMEWMGMLVTHKPGDVVDVVVERGGENIDLKITLQSR